MYFSALPLNHKLVPLYNFDAAHHPLGRSPLPLSHLARRALPLSHYDYICIHARKRQPSTPRYTEIGRTVLSAAEPLDLNSSLYIPFTGSL
jgi:hypothetical protein